MNSTLNPPAPRISVVMCTFNGARFLGEQLESIAQQSRLPDELVVCDDRSDDATVAILQEFANSAPFPVRIFENPRLLGSTRNFDKVISLASGDFIALCDQDDVWAQEKLEWLSDILMKDPSAGGVFSDADLIDENSRPLGLGLFAKHKFSLRKQSEFLRDPVGVLLKHDVLTGATLMFRSALRPHCQPIPQSWVHDAWLAWMIALHSKLALTGAALTSYRIHEGQQLGIGRARDRRIGSATETRRQHYARVARQFEDLSDHLLHSGWTNQDGLIPRLREKVRFLRRQSTLSTSLTIRVLQMIGLFPRYLHYARGLGALRADVLLGREMP
jgi:glycosyltransferase involved in cell wall biosynthesis